VIEGRDALLKPEQWDTWYWHLLLTLSVFVLKRKFCHHFQTCVCDVFSCSFEPPGPMSAGMACELEAIFRPLVRFFHTAHLLFVTGIINLRFTLHVP